MLSDLRESGQVEQDADLVMFVYREEYYNQESERLGEADMIIAKHRNGPIGEVRSPSCRSIRGSPARTGSAAHRGAAGRHGARTERG